MMLCPGGNAQALKKPRTAEVEAFVTNVLPRYCCREDSEDTEDDSEKNIKFKSSELIQINENPEITLNIPKNAIVDDGKPFRCDLCSKTFDTPNALKIHLYIHPTSNEGNS